jgi:hypothetical protein
MRLVPVPVGAGPNKPKHPKKGEYKGQNGRTLVQEDKWTTYEVGNIKFSNPLLLLHHKNISNKEGEDLLKGHPDADKQVYE